MSLVTCDAHKALAETIFCGGSIESDAMVEIRPACLVDGLEYVYADDSALTVPDDGVATVDSCNCPGERVSRPRWMPDGFKPWGPWLGAPVGFICDICGYMCECCADCGGVGGCGCDD